MYDRIAKWYRQGLWTADMVKIAVDKGLLTHDQADEITGTV